MTVSSDGPRSKARPPSTADAFLSAYRRALAALRDSFTSVSKLLGHAWRELQEIERRAAGLPRKDDERLP